MKILTVSTSPYLLTRLGKINSSVLNYLKEKNYDVYSACWNHDTSWFIPDDAGHFFYEHDAQKVAQLFLFQNTPNTASPQLYEIVKAVKPDVVISIGDYQETDFLFALKMLNPDSFKWVSILTMDAFPIQTNRRKCFNYIDYAFSTTKRGVDEIKSFSAVPVEYLPFGPDNFFAQKRQQPEEEPSATAENTADEDNSFCAKKIPNLKIIGVGKNSQSTGIATFLKATDNPNIQAYLHTNYSDDGDYDLDELKKRYNSITTFPTTFTGLNDGLFPEDMPSLYNNYDVITDLSVRAATGLSLLEGMIQGCIPVATRVGALKEIVEKMPKEYQFFVSSSVYVGAYEEEYQIADEMDLRRIFDELSELKKDNVKFDGIKECAKNVAKEYSQNNFLRKIEETINEVAKNRSKMTVETF